MRKLIIAVLAASTATIVHAQAETADQQGRNGGFRAEMRALITGDGMDVDALAALMQERSEARFGSLDANADGVVSREEFMAAVGERSQARFERMKPDENGIVQRDRREGWGRHHRDGQRPEAHGEKRKPGAEERAQRRGERTAEHFARLDTDNDGMISPQEFEAGAKARSERSGERHNWRRAEVPAEMREMHAQLRAMMREGMNLESYSGLMEQRATARFDALDTDGNGELTAEEFTAGVSEHAQNLFARMDRNEDGIVTTDDRPRGGEWRHGPRK